MKALTLSLSVIAILGSAASGYFWYEVGNQKKELQGQLASEQTRANGLQENLTTTTAALESTKTSLASESAAHVDTKSRLTATEAKVIQVSRDLDTTKRSLAAKETSERELQAKYTEIQRELVQARLASQVGTPEEIEKFKQTIAALEARLAGSASTDGSAPAAGATDSAAAAAPAPSARTAAADVLRIGTKNAFVVLGLTAADGIKIGDKFAISRDGAVIASSVISEIKDTYAIAQVVPSSIKSTLQSGDTAALVN